jgi:hypothetical protein
MNSSTDYLLPELWILDRHTKKVSEHLDRALIAAYKKVETGVTVDLAVQEFETHVYTVMHNSNGERNPGNIWIVEKLLGQFNSRSVR